ncbi:hypothetical protein [Cupriavidus sp. PET2-C1]
MASLELFGTSGERLRPGSSAFVLRRFALPTVSEPMPAIPDIATMSPFRHMVTPAGFAVSVALTHSGMGIGIQEQESECFPAMTQLE